MSKCDRIRSWMRSGRAITPVEALNRFGCLRLAARVHDLRADGMTIVTERVERNGALVAPPRRPGSMAFAALPSHYARGPM